MVTASFPRSQSLRQRAKLINYVIPGSIGFWRSCRGCYQLVSRATKVLGDSVISGYFSVFFTQLFAHTGLQIVYLCNYKMMQKNYYTKLISIKKTSCFTFKLISNVYGTDKRSFSSFFLLWTHVPWTSIKHLLSIECSWFHLKLVLQM